MTTQRGIVNDGCQVNRIASYIFITVHFIHQQHALHQDRPQVLHSEHRFQRHVHSLQCSHSKGIHWRPLHAPLHRLLPEVHEVIIFCVND